MLGQILFVVKIPVFDQNFEFLIKIPSFFFIKISSFIKNYIFYQNFDFLSIFGFFNQNFEFLSKIIFFIKISIFYLFLDFLIKIFIKIRGSESGTSDLLVLTELFVFSIFATIFFTKFLRKK